MQQSQNGATKEQDEFRQKMQKLFEVSKREYLHGEALAIGKTLTEMLLRKNGLEQLMLAFDDLGGDALWQNTTVLSSLAKLLSKKPARIQSRDKYNAFILREFLLLANKQDRWANKFQLFLPIFIEQFHSVSPQSVQVHVVDRLLQPFEILLEPEVHSTQIASSAQSKFDARWNDSIWLLSRWLGGLPANGAFACHRRFKKLIPIWTLLLGQALPIEENEQFTNDLGSILITLLKVEQSEMAKTLIQPLLCAENCPNIRLKKIPKQLVMPTEESPNKYPRYGLGIEIVDGAFDGQELLDFRLEGIKYLLKKLPDQERFQLLVDMLDSIFTKINEQTASQFHSNSTEEMRFVNSNCEEIVDEQHNKRFLPHYLLSHVLEMLADFELDNARMLAEMLRVCEIFLNNSMKQLQAKSVENPSNFDVKLPPTEVDQELAHLEMQSLKLVVGIVCTASFQVPANDQKAMNLLKETASKMAEFANLLKNRPKSNEEEELLDGMEKFLNLLKSTFSINFTEEKEEIHSEKRISKPTNPLNIQQNPLDAILANLEELDCSSQHDQNDELANAMRGHWLIEAARLLRQRDTKAFPTRDHFERLFGKLTELLESEDSYVFLAAINALAELVNWQTADFLGPMLALFRDWRPSGDQPSTSDDTKAILVRARIGEALAKVARNLGDFSAHYFDEMASILSAMVREQEPVVRASALSAFADLILACRGRYFDRHLQELIFCVDQLLRLDGNELVRRAAIHLLRSMLGSAAERGLNSLIETFSDSLAPITRQLRTLRSTDPDDVVRLHSELALSQLEDVLRRSFASNPT